MAIVLNLQDRGEKRCKVKIAMYLGYKMIPVKAIGAACILENKSGEFCEASECIHCNHNWRLLLCNCYLLLLALIHLMN